MDDLTPAPPRQPWHALRLPAFNGAGMVFIGELWLSLSRLLSGRARLRRKDLIWQLEQAGPRSVGIVSLVSGLVGVILAYMGAVQLRRFGAQPFIADLVTIGAVREVAALMTGVILAGRLGAAYAAQIGSMQASEEADALKALGLPLMDFLVLPRLLALGLAAPLLTAYAAAVAIVTGGIVACGVFDVAVNDYFHRAWQNLSFNHLMVGLSKGVTYALLVAIAGCRRGLEAGHSAQGVGDATTQAVVSGIVWIVVAASLMTVAYQRLGW